MSKSTMLKGQVSDSAPGELAHAVFFWRRGRRIVQIDRICTATAKYVEKHNAAGRAVFSEAAHEKGAVSGCLPSDNVIFSGP
jgi:hypothetical protein